MTPAPLVASVAAKVAPCRIPRSSRILSDGVEGPAGDVRESAAAAIGVLTVDDDATFRAAVAAIVAATPGFDCVGEACSGEDATSLAPMLHPHLVLMDVRMPGIGGVEAARRIIGRGDAVAVVLMSSDPRLLSPDLVPDGTAGTLRKESLSPTALRALWEGCAARWSPSRRASGRRRTPRSPSPRRGSTSRRAS
jgi:two-component system, NarL family, invasion response regulator UvrY